MIVMGPRRPENAQSFSHFLSKPVRHSQLQNVLRNFFASTTKIATALSSSSSSSSMAFKSSPMIRMSLPNLVTAKGSERIFPFLVFGNFYSFRFFLEFGGRSEDPSMISKSGSGSTSSASPSCSSCSVKILLVDDNLMNQIVVRKLLQVFFFYF